MREESSHIPYVSALAILLSVAMLVKVFFFN